MAEVTFFGIWELVILFFLGGGLLPVSPGVPPLPEDPVLLQVAPEETILFVEWFGLAEPDPSSPNRTERLAAEKEVRDLVRTAVEAIERGFRENLRGREQRLAEEALRLAKLAVSRPGALFVSRLDLSGRGVPFEGGIVLRAGERASDIRGALEAIESFLLREMSRTEVPPEPTKLDVEGATFRILPLPLPPEAPPVAWGVADDFVVLAVGEGIPARIAKAIRAGASGAGGRDGAGLAAREPFRRLLSSVRVERPCSRVFVDLAAILELARSAGGPQIAGGLSALGLSGVTGFLAENGLEGEGFVSRTLLATTGASAGLLKLADGAPIQDADLAVIPEDATIAAALRLDPLAAYREFLAFIDRVAPNGRREFEDQVVEEIEEELGLRLVEDILEPLGDVWTVWSAPSEGGLLVTGLTGAVRLKDRARAERSMERIVETMRREMGQRTPGRGRGERGVFVESFPFAGTKIYYINAVGEEMPVAPSWCLTETHLLVSLYPQMLKAALARGAAPESSLAKHPALGGRSPAFAITYFDVPEAFRLAYPLLHPLAQMALSEIQREGVDLTIAALPSASAILPHLLPAVGTAERTDLGIRFVSRGTLPSAGPLGAGALAPLFLLGSYHFVAEEVPAPGVDFDRMAPAEKVVPTPQAAPTRPGDAERPAPPAPPPPRRRVPPPAPVPESRSPAKYFGP